MCAGSGITVWPAAAARQAGWLFPIEIPKRIDCFKVWTLQDFGKVGTG